MWDSDSKAFKVKHLYPKFRLKTHYFENSSHLYNIETARGFYKENMLLLLQEKSFPKFLVCLERAMGWVKTDLLDFHSIPALSWVFR